MSRRTLTAVQLGAAAVVVLVLALAGGGRYPLYVDLAVYAAGAAMAATAVAQLGAAHDRRKRRHPDDVPEEVTPAQALKEAADWVITGRPADDYHGLTLTAEMVQREVLMRSGLEVSHSDAAFMLHERLAFRGYGLPPELRSFAWEYGDLDREDPR